MAEKQQVTLASGITVTTERPIMDLADFHRWAEAAGWRFVCPRCGNVASAADFKSAGADPKRAAQECLGRVGSPDWDALKTATDAKPCDWAAFGLLGTRGNGVLVRFPDGKVVESFAPDAERPA